MTSLENRLLKKAKAGNKPAFGRLVMKHQKEVLHLAHDYCGNYDDAKEIMQTTFINAFENIQSFREDSALSTWLYRIAANKAKDHLRRKKRIQLVNVPDQNVDLNLEIPEELTSTDLEKNEKNLVVNEAIQKLNGKQKEAVILKFFHNKSARAIGQIIECEETTARVHLFRGLEKLRGHLKEYILE